MNPINLGKGWWGCSKCPSSYTKKKAAEKCCKPDPMALTAEDRETLRKGDFNGKV